MRSSSSTLQLQLGQEVLYLLLSIFSFSALVLGLMALGVKQENATLKREVIALSSKVSDLSNALIECNRRIAVLLKLERELEQVRDEKRTAELKISDLQAEILRLRARIAALEDSLKKIEEALLKTVEATNDKPPIINLSEARGYTFASGESGLSDDFKKRLTDVVIPSIVAEGERHKANVIEVLGHTDDVRVPARQSNLDVRLLSFLRREGNDVSLAATDNVGLGMSRAASVVRHLMTDPRLVRYTVVPLSAGQAIDTAGVLATSGANEREAPERRRIEIRIRR